MDKIGTASIRCVGTARDRHHQVLARCYLDDLDLNGWLVQHGHALAYGHDSQLYSDEEDEAKRMKRGLWAGTFTSPWDWR